jgi:F subunit of K+-transporting ATPase (Potass_KdpF)
MLLKVPAKSLRDCYRTLLAGAGGVASRGAGLHGSGRRERVMSVIQGILLAVSIVVFVYLGIAMFKPEWF